MGRKAMKQQPKTYQCKSNESGWGFIPIYRSLLWSPAYRDLTPKEKEVLTECMAQTHGEASKDYAKENQGKPYQENRFYMNRALSVELGLFAESDRRSLTKAMRSLIEHGFIDCVADGYASKSRSVYKLSNRWKRWGSPEFEVPDGVKTMAMRARDMAG